MANNYFSGYPQQYQQPSNSVIVVPVQGEQGANIYPVAAGNTVLLMDFNTKRFWIKATDINGLPSKFAAFDFTEVVRPLPQNETNFISRNEFDEWKKSTDAQLQQIIALVGGNANASATAKQPNATQATV